MPVQRALAWLNPRYGTAASLAWLKVIESLADAAVAAQQWGQEMDDNTVSRGRMVDVTAAISD